VETLTRDEHIAWCKKRALEYVDNGEVINAITSIASDLRKHPETKNHPGIQLGIMMLMLPSKSSDLEWARKFIDGFR